MSYRGRPLMIIGGRSSSYTEEGESGESSTS